MLTVRDGITLIRRARRLGDAEPGMFETLSEKLQATLAEVRRTAR